jgi:hypothetical protein
MYPPKVSDGQIHALIGELSRAGRPPSGARLRAALAARFGSRGGVARIYALLAQSRVQPAPPRAALPATPSESVEDWQQQALALREQMQLAREREEADQSRWAQEIDRLRQKVAHLEPLALQAQMLRETADLLRHRLQAADIRLGRMEGELLRLQQELEKRDRSGS